MARPTVPFLNWTPDNDPQKVVEPSGSKKTQGWSPNEPLPAQNMNWLLYSIDQWLQYAVESADRVGGQIRSVLGTTAQMNAGAATHDDPQEAYDAAVAEGGGVMLVLEGSMSGNLNLNDSTGVIVKGLGYQSEINGNVTMSAPRNVFLGCRVAGNFTISSSDCFADQVWLAFTSSFVNSSSNQRNFYRITGGTNGLYMSHPGKGGAGVSLVLSGPFQLNESHNGKTMLVDLSSGPLEVLLPTPRLNYIVTLKDYRGFAAINSLTITPPGSSMIEGLNEPFNMQINYQSKTLISDGADWYSI